MQILVGEVKPKSSMFNEMSTPFFLTEILWKPQWLNLIILLGCNSYFINIFLQGFFCLIMSTLQFQTVWWMLLFYDKNFNSPPSAPMHTQLCVWASNLEFMLPWWQTGHALWIIIEILHPYLA